MIGVGFSGAKASLEKLPGWEPGSWAYHGDDGKAFGGDSPGKSYGPKFTTGDVIGCGVNFKSGSAFFTKNGNFLGASTDMDPCMGYTRILTFVIRYRFSRPERCSALSFSWDEETSGALER